MSGTDTAAMPLRLVTLACHVVVIATLAASVLTTPTWPRVAGTLALGFPLLLTLPGLVRGARTAQPWLAVLLVAYIGGATVEVVARAGAAPLLNALLFAAVLELALLLALIRRSRPRVPDARE